MTVAAASVTRELLLIAQDLEALAAIRDRGQDAYLTPRVDQANGGTLPRTAFDEAPQTRTVTYGRGMRVEAG